MNIGVIGLGSMGKRRIRLTQEAFPELTLVGVDFREDRRQETEKLFEIKTADSLTEANKLFQLDAVFICASPVTHEVIILEALRESLHVFTEINLLNNYYDQAIELAAKQNKLLYISSTFLKRREIQYIREQVKSDAKLTYRYHVGQYLPDWHPWESYKDFFVADKKTNGCREIFAIELPWITQVFGDIISYELSSQKISSLEIDYPDSYTLILHHETGIVGSLNVNVVSRVAVRNLNIIGEETQIDWDGTPGGLNQWGEKQKQMVPIQLYGDYTSDDNYSRTIIEDAYLEEIKEFIKLLKSQTEKASYTFLDDKKIIDWINNFEEE
ncbi:Gfo/Idh/MocA family oxidoreductase [uncultured Vagococcus sp.]|uniref:Gfo/Idh/MocA family protein n=1 Tax=uncultured Vagococcus sp. TaxID=189676 RepID=UPI0028D7F679|nr:Gfo/Idh/MocA family oxidoreductase [uncultured Vagococcus sp.]